MRFPILSAVNSVYEVLKRVLLRALLLLVLLLLMSLVVSVLAVVWSGLESGQLGVFKRPSCTRTMPLSPSPMMTITFLQGVR